MIENQYECAPSNGIDPQLGIQLREAAKWAKIASVISFVFIGLMIVALVLLASMRDSLMDEYGRQSALRSDERTTVMIGYGLYYFVLVLIYFILVLLQYLYRGKNPESVKE